MGGRRDWRRRLGEGGADPGRGDEDLADAFVGGHAVPVPEDQAQGRGRGGGHVGDVEEEGFAPVRGVGVLADAGLMGGVAEVERAVSARERAGSFKKIRANA